MLTENNEFRVYTFSHVFDQTQRQKRNKHIRIKLIRKKYMNIYILEKEVHVSRIYTKVKHNSKKVGETKNPHVILVRTLKIR